MFSEVMDASGGGSKPAKGSELYQISAQVDFRDCAG